MTDETRVCLDLFSGLGGFSAAFEESDDWQVVTVDIDPEDRFDPDLRADVMDLRPANLVGLLAHETGVPFEDVDVLVVLAGHPCTLFSTAGNHDEWDMERRSPDGPRAREHVAMLFHTLGLIHALDPTFWYLENPRRSRASWFVGPPEEWVTYCQYGTDYQKPTGLWGDHAPGMTYRRCSRGESCHAAHTDDDGYSAIQSMPSDTGERAKVPYDLSAAIRDAVEAALDGPTFQQASIGEVTRS